MINPPAVTDEVAFPDADRLITEDDTPVDNFASAKQQRLLVSSLYSSLGDRTFLAEANVGIYHSVSQPPVVPDVFVSLDVRVPANWWEKPNRCYLVWNFGKPPEIVLEIVSNRVGNELTSKLQTYARMRASYYIVYDPAQHLGGKTLYLYELQGWRYVELSQPWVQPLALGLTLWQGEFEGHQETWLRWRDATGNLLLTGDEKAERAQEQAERAQEQAERAQEQAERERQRAERLAALLQARGIDPDAES